MRQTSISATCLTCWNGAGFKHNHSEHNSRQTRSTERKAQGYLVNVYKGLGGPDQVILLIDVLSNWAGKAKAHRRLVKDLPAEKSSSDQDLGLRVVLKPRCLLPGGLGELGFLCFDAGHAGLENIYKLESQHMKNYARLENRSRPSQKPH